MIVRVFLPAFALFSLLVGSLSVVAQESVPGEYRHWTTSDGTRSTVRLKLVDERDGHVQLQREDNSKLVVMPLTRLSVADRRYLSERNAASPTPTATSDWPQWRGPNRDGKSPATGLPTQWDAEGPRLIWTISGLGEGYSTPAVVGDTVYVLGTRANEEYIFARNFDDGNGIWESRVGTKSGGGGFPGPKGTPAVEDGRIYAIGSDGTLVCVNQRDGSPVWKKSFKRDFGGEHGHWEYAESPLIDGDKVICTPGGNSGCVVALRKDNGAPIWSSPVGRVMGGDFARAGYASTIVATIAGTKQYIAFLHGGVVGVDAARGTPLWHYDAPANGTANCSTPVVEGDSVFAASAYGTGGGKARVAKRGSSWNVSEEFFVKKMESHHGGFVLHEGYIYGTNNSVLMCLDWDTGAVKWQDRCVGKGSITYADGHLYVRGERGEVALVEATPSGYREKGRFTQPYRSDKNAWAHPVIAGNRLYLHDHDRLLCYELK
ncbi:PQQ-like beta-propeller repeat protein [Aporhodopirellula aestuarii]|uniref:PQQ-like beta-propeller repeat protein n=1 Tax=Aporhodopirellula aestuarii TaxID=2950107 RepID=A0ABT0TZX8_9BACT|nr:PQQ-like beta-propeller repeat protein [Aporhodopirellula aestuarii]MCM2370187.1 PQQ-like beta-propeller repeat protein [Aporhodopirellula aestuarii]